MDKKQKERLDFESRNKLLTQVALRQATSNPVKMIGSVKVFFLKDDWQSEWLAQESSIYKPTNFQSLKDAIEDPSVKTIFIPENIYVPVSALSFLCAKASIEKIIFIQGDANA